jgi:hypothetical protein
MRRYATSILLLLTLAFTFPAIAQIRTLVAYVGSYPAPGSFGRTSASISVIDAHTSQIVFAYSVGKAANTNQLQSTVEACAKHLNEFIEKSEKPKK